MYENVSTNSDYPLCARNYDIRYEGIQAKQSLFSQEADSLVECGKHITSTTTCFVHCISQCLTRKLKITLSITERIECRELWDGWWERWETKRKKINQRSTSVGSPSICEKTKGPEFLPEMNHFGQVKWELEPWNEQNPYNKSSRRPRRGRKYLNFLRLPFQRKIQLESSSHGTWEIYRTLAKVPTT